ncbi:proteophosphoglycan ppg4 [Rhodotorula toruloides]|uniref:Proteophosphoglycan ppg4 n=1 Tax=Rhodotorula toruloides TaxID=5286 RepID=A0A511KGW7_RHOTO|nr:proteophosphoglycan ppg4 [Rhodotorula toruloides]
MVLLNSLDDLKFSRFLDLGPLPVTNFCSPKQGLTEYCAHRDIELQWIPVGRPSPDSEEAEEPGEKIDPDLLLHKDELVVENTRHPRAILQREAQFGDIDPSDALVEDPFGSTPSSREATPAEECAFEVVIDDVSNSSDTESSATSSPPSSPTHLPPSPDDPRLASDYKAHDTAL